MEIKSKNVQGILWMLLTGFLAMSINSLARYLSTDFHPFQLVFFYNILGLLFFMPYLWRQKVSVRTDQDKLYAIRAMLEFVSFSLIFYALTRMPLPVVTALSFTSPIFGSIAAVLFLKEKSSFYRWAAMLVGFAGVLIVARPGITDFSASSWMVLASSIGFALCGICIKKLTHYEPNGRIVFYMLFYTALISAPFAYRVWHMPELSQLGLLLLLGALVAGVQYSVSQAFSKADITVIIPIFFFNLVWASIYAYFLFEEVVDVWTILGALVIISSTVYSARRAHRETKSEIAATELSSGGN